MTTKMRRKIKWFKLKDDLFKQQFREKVVQEIYRNMADVNGWWTRVNETLLKVGKKVLGATSGKIWQNKEIWWFNPEIQEKTRLKKLAKKRWEETRQDTDKESTNKGVKKQK